MQKKTNPIESQTYRLNKYIALCGSASSRRNADTLIEAGQIHVNGTPVTDFSFQVNPATHKVTLRGVLIAIQKERHYILLNKGKDTISTTKDEKNRKTIIDFLPYPFKNELKPVGRLDRNTTGLILLTNDGDLINLLTHPTHLVDKIYKVTLDKKLNPEDLERIQQGIELEDGFFKPDAVEILDVHNALGVQIHSGKNRIVRRYFEAFGFQVKALDRVFFAGLTKHKLPRGKSRILTEKEVRFLKASVKKNPKTT
ncbi:MAG: rRNA pseudouridine synthase [Bacteroidetes bacterium]|nr:rRNA pseudouridine synthase [Bacteroidota bacterium]